MEKQLQGRIAFVTGGAQGIGQATALAFAREGAKVAIADLKDAGETIEAIRRLGGEGYGERLDVTEEGAVDAMVDGIVARWGRLDIGFNNAGIALEAVATAWGDLAIYDRLVATNQRAVLLCMTAELRHMTAQRSGAIVNTASIAGLSGVSGAGYSASKHAVVGLTRSAALRHAADGIRINCVCPGAIWTEMTQQAAQEPEAAELMAQMHPMRRFGQAEEVAEGVLFLASDRASFITGHPLAIDGGFLAG
ncbi:SDR family oxidoreductase [Flavisphingomonas formosensis]|uniref:SDR family oxidoreductase n=1 Tax=Flavisphingomonas formosensis TaxID=861534 RepID=UPI0012FA17CF|nr:SDR family oxidoreductase [Sphingomonas formosensis]